MIFVFVPGQEDIHVQILATAAVIVLAVLFGLAYILWFGLKILSRPFPPHAEPTRDAGTVAVPDGLPAPVCRHFAALFGGSVTRTDSAVIWGRGKVRTSGLWTPLRFRTHASAGVAFTRRAEITWFGIPIVRSVDSYIEGQGRLAASGIISRSMTGDEMGLSQLMILWTEAVWTPVSYTHLRAHET